jgi:hypothetical protein
MHRHLLKACKINIVKFGQLVNIWDLLKLTDHEFPQIPFQPAAIPTFLIRESSTNATVILGFVISIGERVMLNTGAQEE